MLEAVEGKSQVLTQAGPRINKEHLHLFHFNQINSGRIQRATEVAAQHSSNKCEVLTEFDGNPLLGFFIQFLIRIIAAAKSLFRYVK